MRRKTDLSLVIPVYNEEKRLGSGLQTIIKYLQAEEFSWELIVVDDGSSDQTITLARRFVKNIDNARVLKSPHLGKGGAIKQGVLNANGKWVLFLDIDLATPMTELGKFMNIRNEYDVIIGSRKMKGANVLVHQPKFREFGGKVFTALTNVLVTKGISDITCGFKLFRTKWAKTIFARSLLSDWSFDAEILFLAQKSELRIKELPVRWVNDPRTKVNLFKDTLRSFSGLVKIRVYDILGRYG
ncbi:MAG: hypothetical protein A3A65_04480 [Candidatus Chisholmbacteria bacterium RIFCSPLOWO2_01_FULL_49_14]|uniref:dolichyl-phosphate beta-glucosyltransferase n=1 Tax=Candidatus Chisholmbacteria bacterium RIFCSPLOWO2_01_FULL_49_14 TaxID=1797593 RepID=A0A1G1W446_9BACT|nr:MAG: hypothetical protein A3A65_04480 [Candidatus Chisholmbacteria bacterium RIFCSPLOWO2_01_FULL_49_14]